jgi:hypothetical protein
MLTDNAVLSWTTPSRSYHAEETFRVEETPRSTPSSEQIQRSITRSRYRGDEA